MKKIVLIALAVFMLAMCSNAQVPSKPFSIYVGGGLSFPTSPDVFTEVHKMGYNFMGGIGFKAAPFVQLIGKVEYHAILKDFEALGVLYDVASGGKITMWMFGVDAKLTPNLPAVPVKPFVLAGIGFARASQQDIEPALLADLYSFETQTKFYYNFGGGIELKSMPMFSIFLQARYVGIAFEDETLVMVPVTLGIKF